MVSISVVPTFEENVENADSGSTAMSNTPLPANSTKLLSAGMELHTKIGVPDFDLDASQKELMLSSASYDDDNSENRYKLRRRSKRTDVIDTDNTDMESTVWRLLQPAGFPDMDFMKHWIDAPRPDYTHILDNDYTLSEEPSFVTPNAVDAADLTRKREMRRWICDCLLPATDELKKGVLACGPGCINRALNLECGPRCPAYDACSNRQFQLRLYAKAEPFYAGPGKGWGLRAIDPIKQGDFVVEYVGEVISFFEFKRRIRNYEKAKRVHHYFMALGAEQFIDAGTKGNWARFVNHSCEPNSETQKWSVNGQIRIGFFAKCDIPSGEEITIDYQFAQYGASEQKCYCGTSSCSGIMGATSKQLQEKVRLKDTRAVERRVCQLLDMQVLRTSAEVTLLLQVMVQECLTRYTRMELLKLLVNTKNESYLKLFRQYNGLEVIASYMYDAAETDWDLKRQILYCLIHIPVSEQKQVGTGSDLFGIVCQWMTDPRYSHPRMIPVECATDISEEHGPVSKKFKPDVAATTDNTESISPTSTSPTLCTVSRVAYLPTAVKDLVESAPPMANSSHAQVKSNSVRPRTCRLRQFRDSGFDTPQGFSTASPCSSTSSGISSGSWQRRLTHTNSATQLSSISSADASSPSFSASSDWASEGGDSAYTSTSQQTPVTASLSSQLEVNSSEADGCVMINYETGETELVESISYTDTERADSLHSASAPVESQNEDEVIEELKRLAKTLYQKWLQLPVETYRIPRLEREETEKILKQSNEYISALVSWGSKQEELLDTSSWNQDLLPAKSSSRSLVSKSNEHQRARNRVEHRKRFEACLRAAEVFTIPTPDPPLEETTGNPSESASPEASDESDTAELLKSLLAKTLEHKLKTSLSAGTHDSSERLSLESVNSLSKTIYMFVEKRDKAGLLKYLQGCGECSPVANTIDCAPVTTQATPAPELPPNWNSTVDPTTGVVYFYNSVTRAVQWTKPLVSVASSTNDTSTGKKSFSVAVYGHVSRLLRPYRLPNCLTGRIQCNADFKYLSKKLTSALVQKEIRRSRHRRPFLDDAAIQRISRSVMHYMTSRGPVYQKTHRSAVDNSVDMDLSQ